MSSSGVLSEFVLCPIAWVLLCFAQSSPLSRSYACHIVYPCLFFHQYILLEQSSHFFFRITCPRKLICRPTMFLMGSLFIFVLRRIFSFDLALVPLLVMKWFLMPIYFTLCWRLLLIIEFLLIYISHLPSNVNVEPRYTNGCLEFAMHVRQFVHFDVQYIFEQNDLN